MTNNVGETEARVKLSLDLPDGMPMGEKRMLIERFRKMQGDFFSYCRFIHASYSSPVMPRHDLRVPSAQDSLSTIEQRL